MLECERLRQKLLDHEACEEDECVHKEALKEARMMRDAWQGKAEAAEGILRLFHKRLTAPGRNHGTNADYARIATNVELAWARQLEKDCGEANVELGGE